jgi:hypothetical protein
VDRKERFREGAVEGVVGVEVAVVVVSTKVVAVLLVISNSKIIPLTTMLVP